MTIQEFYSAIGEDFDAVLRRLMVEARISKYVKKFVDDKNLELLKTSIDEGNVQEAFRAVHTLKGMALNLGFEKLFTCCSELTERLRVSEASDADIYYGKIKAEYDTLIENIKLLD